MPKIRIVRLEYDPESEFPAAAVIAVMLSSASQPIKDVLPNHVKIERTLPRNQSRLTVDDHVFPLCSMQGFTCGKRVSAFEMRKGRSRPVKP